MSQDETEVRELFATRYSAARQDIHRQIERTVIGGDRGANGYTTVTQADELGRLQRAWAVAASAGALPLRPGCLDAVVAADVLC
jgi:hypothetical protein